MAMKDMTHEHTSQGRPPASKDEDKREKILDSALLLFAGQGVAGTTIAQIAKASGVTSAMVHYYFGNREKLLDHLVAERLAPCLEYVWGSVSDEALTDPRQLLTSFVDRLLESVEKVPQLPQLWSREILNAGGCLRERVMALVPLEGFEKVHRSLALAQREGRLNAHISPGLVLTSVMSVTMLPLAAQDMLDRVPTIPVLNMKMLRQHVLALLLDGLCPGKNMGEG